jgi:SWIM zinc finger
LKEYLTDPEDDHYGRLGDQFRNKLTVYLTSKFVDLRYQLFHCHFFRTPQGRNTTSNVVEAENLTLQKMYCGPRPKDQLDGARKKINKTNDIREQRKSTASAYHLTARPSKNEHRQGFLDRVTRFAGNNCVQQQSASNRQCVYIVSQKQYWVKHDSSTRHTGCLEEQSQTEATRIKLRADWIIPRFERTRTVNVITRNDQYWLVCSCGVFIECGWACRHMYAVLNRGFLYTDVHVRFWTIYSRDYSPGSKGITESLDIIRTDYDAVGGIQWIIIP